MQAKITGTGSYLPQQVLTNHDLEAIVDTSHEWIHQRVGIDSRHIANDFETTAFMSQESAKRALEAAKLAADEIDLIIVATATADKVFPSVACEVQEALGISDCMAFDINAACTGFIYSLSIAKQFITNGKYKNALVIATERMSRVLNWQDRATCVLFGDGSGAVALSACDEENKGILSTHLHADGTKKDWLWAPNNLPIKPFEAEVKLAHLQMEGNKVFKCAATMLGTVVEEGLLANNLTKDDIDWLVPHQANVRIIKATAKKFNLPMEKVILTLQTHGNTSGASIPLALDVAVRDGRIKPGHLLVLEAFGAGLVWGSAVVRY